MLRRSILTTIIMLFIPIVISSCFFNTGSEKERPNDVPESAFWSGGPDGGYWIDFVEEHNGLYRYRIYSDYNGELMLDADFVFFDDILPQMTNWETSVCCFEEADSHFSLELLDLSETDSVLFVLHSTNTLYGGYYTGLEQLCAKHPTVIWKGDDRSSITIYDDPNCKSKERTICKDSLLGDSTLLCLRDKTDESFNVFVLGVNSGSLLASGWIKKSEFIKVMPQSNAEFTIYERPEFSSKIVAKYQNGISDCAMSVLDFSDAEWLYVEFGYAGKMFKGWIPLGMYH